MNPDFYLVIDFEATCDDQGRVPRREMEIIEFGAVMVDAHSLQIVSEFGRFIRPVRHPLLTPFCQQLTSIRQADVDAAADFAAVIAEVRTWIADYPNLMFGSWGDYDRHQLQQDCDYHKVPYPIPAGHINLKKQFAQAQMLPKALGLGQAVRFAGLAFVGTHHRGIDDARNIAALLPWILQSTV